MQSSRKQPSRRLEKRENSRRWLLIPALCAAVILAVVLIVELNKQPQVLPDNSNTTPVSHDQPTTPDPEPEPDPEPIPELLTLVNPWNQVPEDWTVDLVTLPNGLEIDKRCTEAAQGTPEAQSLIRMPIQPKCALRLLSIEQNLHFVQS